MSEVAGRRPVHVGGLSDDELVQLARSGHEPAFDAIVHRYRAPLQSYCRRWLDSHRAEEVVQHTLMKAFLCVRDDDRPLVLRPWLYRVAHNAALNAVEKKGSEWEQLDENYDGVPQPPYVAEQRARFLAVVGEIEALPSRQREALLLNEFEGRCYADIAAQLGTSESGVRGLLRRARRQLRETAAAVLLPFPFLREFVRSEGGRGLQADRAGDLIGTAGAAGGVGAAGGFAKVAAGVLAAGTIASGGSAIHSGGEPVRVPDAKTDVAAAPEADRTGVASSALVGAPLGPRDAFAVSRTSAGGANLVASAGLTPREGSTNVWLDQLESSPPPAEDPDPDEPEPLLPLTPPAAIDGEAQEGPAEEEPAADGGEEQTPKDEAADEPQPQDQPAEEEPPADEQAESADDPNPISAAPLP